MSGGATAPVIPAESVLAKWLAAKSADERQSACVDVQKLLTSGPPAAKDNPDAALYRQFASLRGPLLSGVNRRDIRKTVAARRIERRRSASILRCSAIIPNGRAIDRSQICACKRRP